jgi:diaminohydroxyphosphoribosylaminopyrimidine deaminase/5-amino-6-(5-phosphoribosylamino)uracil reductase
LVQSQLVTRELAWELLLTLAERARALRPLCNPAGFSRRTGRWLEVPECEAEVWLDPVRRSARGMARDAEQLCAQLMPLVVGAGASSLVIARLEQSLDGRVATRGIAPPSRTGREDVLHTHRLRALFDAVIVGVRTVQLLDPQLTTRHVPGPHPTRVVLDPQGRLRGPHKLLEDGVASTLVLSARERVHGRVRLGNAEWVGIGYRDGRFEFEELRAVLRERGLARLFIEGGGVTVARFLAGRALDRLHVSVAPVILGSGAPAFALPPAERLEQALRPRCRTFALGSDVLFDCELA